MHPFPITLFANEVRKMQASLGAAAFSDQFVWRNWQIPNPSSACMIDGVGECAGDSRNSDFSDAARTDAIDMRMARH
jgi:hypothetical protein